ncbi:hypothetical protein BACCIP111899_02476 [Bacillus rhizoplanae]|uniref:Uncharacterized protein n=1 Tax=Bacillus rhizoplanae TaxID=2880966 RepID=A0ABM8YBV6_9BACI|nr:hypothetical protein BACCIP111899_02476 [Bacillus rhizoplanae]
MLSSQIYISILLYRYEKSVWWGCIRFFLSFGLNVHVYLALTGEKIPSIANHNAISFYCCLHGNTIPEFPLFL